MQAGNRWRIALCLTETKNQSAKRALDCKHAWIDARRRMARIALKPPKDRKAALLGRDRTWTASLIRTEQITPREGIGMTTPRGRITPSAHRGRTARTTLRERAVRTTRRGRTARTERARALHRIRTAIGAPQIGALSNAANLADPTAPEAPAHLLPFSHRSSTGCRFRFRR